MKDLKVKVVDTVVLTDDVKIKTKRERRMVLVLSEEELTKLLEIGVELKSSSVQRTIRTMIANY